jgi:hypothetical protein
MSAHEEHQKDKAVRALLAHVTADPAGGDTCWLLDEDAGDPDAYARELFATLRGPLLPDAVLLLRCGSERCVRPTPLHRGARSDFRKQTGGAR